MKTIKAVSIWDKGTVQEAKVLNAYAINVVLNNSATFYYQLLAETAEAEGYIPFEQLTEEIVVGWLTSVLDVPAMEKQIEDAIYLINNPVMVQLSLPNN